MDAQEVKFTQQALRAVWPAVCLAEEVGKGLAGCAVLLGTLPGGASVWCYWGGGQARGGTEIAIADRTVYDPSPCQTCPSPMPFPPCTPR